MQHLSYGQAAKLSLGDLRRYMVYLGFSTATKLSKRGMLFVLQRYPDGPHRV